MHTETWVPFTWNAFLRREAVAQAATAKVGFIPDVFDPAPGKSGGFDLVSAACEQIQPFAEKKNCEEDKHDRQPAHDEGVSPAG